jgi:hypothetical protein
MALGKNKPRKCSPPLALKTTIQQNFQSAMQLYSTLNLTPIERLEKEWNSLPKKVSQMYERLKVPYSPSCGVCVVCGVVCVCVWRCACVRAFT